MKEQFKKLSLTGKYRILQEKGVELAERFHGSYHIHLYQVDNFYVEAWYKIGINSVYWIELPNHQQLETYLNKVNLKLD